MPLQVPSGKHIAYFVVLSSLNVGHPFFFFFFQNSWLEDFKIKSEMGPI